MPHTIAFAPNLSHLFETFDNQQDVLRSQVDGTNVSDDYLKALYQIGAYGEALDTKEWKFMQWSGRRRATAFGNMLLQWDEVNSILKEIGDTGKTPSEKDDDTTKTLQSWLEQLGFLCLENGKYVVSTINNDEESELSHPILDETIDIKEDHFSIFEYLRMIKKGLIVMNPDFQRNLVWNIRQKSQFIESVLIGLPLPPIYMKKEVDDVHYIIVDGLQRTTALIEYMNGDFALQGLEPEGNNRLEGIRFDNLDNVKPGLQAKIESKQLFFYTMQSTVRMEIVYDIFNRINTGGTQLSRQEIRNCILLGPATVLLKEIAQSEEFKQAVYWGISDLRMKDRESVLRCIAFAIQDYELTYDGAMDKYLENTMRRINKMDNSQIQDLKNKVLYTLKTSYDIFQERNFRIPTEYTRGRINIAVMETVFHCLYNARQAPSPSSFSKLNQAYSQMLKEKGFIDSVHSSTSSITAVQTRFRIAHNYLDQHLR